MFEVCELEGVRFKKYVLRNRITGIRIDQRYWTIRGAQRAANMHPSNRLIEQINQTIRRFTTTK